MAESGSTELYFSVADYCECVLCFLSFRCFMAISISIFPLHVNRICNTNMMLRVYKDCNMIFYLDMTMHVNPDCNWNLNRILNLHFNMDCNGGQCFQAV